MGKYINLFNKQCSEFVRVFLFDTVIKVEHFKTGLLISSREFNNGEDLKNTKNELLCLLIGLHLPIELVTSHRSMAYRLFSSKVSNTKNLYNIAIHSLTNSHCNTVFYGKISPTYDHPNVQPPKTYTYGIWTCDISDEITKLLLSNSYDLNIISVSVFPLWVTYAFYSKYRSDSNSPTLFVVEYLDYWHIILMNNGYVVYSRNGHCVKDSDIIKKQEVENTLNYIQSVMNVNIKNLIIYEFGNDVIDAISFCSNLKMKMASTDVKVLCTKKTKNGVVKIACLIFSGMIFSHTILNTYKINRINIKMQDFNQKIKQNDRELSKSINTWQELHDKNLLNQPNYQYAIKNFTKDKKVKLNTITMYWDNSSGEIEIDNVTIDEPTS